VAHVINSYVERCHDGCPTTAKVTEWSCGCVDVEIRNDRNPCSRRRNFSSRRRRCGRSGRPDHGWDGGWHGL